MSHAIDISDLSKSSVLAALYNASRPMGMGMLRVEPGEMDEFEAAKLCGVTGDDHDQDFPTVSHNRERLYFDYVKGRPLKVDLSGDTLDPRLFDRDNGNGSAAKAIAQLREKEGSP